MHKIDRIRRKLEQTKRDSLLHQITVNALPRPQPQPQHSSLPTTLSLFPIIAKNTSRDASTDHSERSQNHPSRTDSTFFTRRTQRTRDAQRPQVRARKWEEVETVRELAAHSLTPSVRMNGTVKHNFQSTPKKKDNCFISAQTPKTVIILTEPNCPSGNTHRTLFRKVAPKRQSLMIRNTSTPERQESPTRKFSISAWETDQ